MSILWCGGEDIDFPNGSALTISTTAGVFRSGYARCNIMASGSGSIAKSMQFPGGGVSSLWFSCRIKYATNSNAGQNGIGLANFGAGKGIILGGIAPGGTKLTLSTYDLTTTTNIASESGTSLNTGAIQRLDIQLIGPLSSATVNVYLDGALLITYSGNLSFSSSISTFDIVWIGNNGVASMPGSEFIVADEDTRAMSLVTLALTGAGTTDNWTASTFSNINSTTINDASPMSVNVTATDSQFNVTDLPSGSFDVRAVKIAARMAKSASPAVTQVKLGYNDGGTVAFGTGATKALTTAYATYEQLDSTNPHGAASWTQSIMNALQLDAQSLT